MQDIEAYGKVECWLHIVVVWTMKAEVIKNYFKKQYPLHFL